MDIPNLTALAAKLREPETAAHFHLQLWFATKNYNAPANINACGTTACIAGWATLLAEPDHAMTGREFANDAEDIATEWLGLTSDQAWELFVGWPDAEATPAQAADVIDNLIATGEVKWN